MERHDLDGVSLVGGLLFVSTGLAYLFGWVDVTRSDPWMTLAVAAVVLGAVLVVRLLRRARAQASPGSRSSDTEFMQ